MCTQASSSAPQVTTLVINGISYQEGDIVGRGSFSNVFALIPIAQRALGHTPPSPPPAPLVLKKLTLESQRSKEVRASLLQELAILREMPRDRCYLQPSPLALFKAKGAIVGYITPHLGEPLRDLNSSRLTKEQKAQLSLQFLKGLQELFTAKVIDIDLHASNVLIATPPDGPKLTFIDFGVALIAERTLPLEANARDNYLGELEYYLIRPFIAVPMEEVFAISRLLYRLTSKDGEERIYDSIISSVRSIQIFSVGFLLYYMYTGSDVFSRVHPAVYEEGRKIFTFKEGAYQPGECVCDLRPYHNNPSRTEEALLYRRDTLIEFDGCDPDMANLIARMVHPDPAKRPTPEELFKQFA